MPPPEIEEPEQQPLPQPAASLNKHYRIIFIKAPSQSQPKIIAPQIASNEEKTIVYVLVKKPENQEIIPIEQPEQKHEKPEVYFIKYNAKKETIPAPLPVPSESTQSNDAVIIDPRTKAPQFPALDEQNAIEVPEETPIDDNTSINVEIPAPDTDSPSKKYIPA